MLTRTSKNVSRQRIHGRIRKKMVGTQDRPRLNVYRSLNHIYAQVIDDLKGVTIAAASTAEGKKSERTTGGNVASAKSVGKTIAERAKQCSTAAVTFITDALRRWRMRREKRD